MCAVPNPVVVQLMAFLAGTPEASLIEKHTRLSQDGALTYTCDLTVEKCVDTAIDVADSLVSLLSRRRIEKHTALTWISLLADPIIPLIQESPSLFIEHKGYCISHIAARTRESRTSNNFIDQELSPLAFDEFCEKLLPGSLMGVLLLT